MVFLRKSPHRHVLNDRYFSACLFAIDDFIDALVFRDYPRTGSQQCPVGVESSVRADSVCSVDSGAITKADSSADFKECLERRN
jgi:hypothetical protein